MGSYLLTLFSQELGQIYGASLKPGFIIQILSLVTLLFLAVKVFYSIDRLPEEQFKINKRLFLIGLLITSISTVVFWVWATSSLDSAEFGQKSFAGLGLFFIIDAVLYSLLFWGFGYLWVILFDDIKSPIVFIPFKKWRDEL